MQGAVFALVVNIAVAALFAASFAVLAFTNPSHRRAAGSAVSYAIGMMTPISEFLLPLFSWPAPFMIASYFCFAAGLLAMPIALSIFYRKPGALEDGRRDLPQRGRAALAAVGRRAQHHALRISLSVAILLRGGLSNT